MREVEEEEGVEKAERCNSEEREDGGEEVYSIDERKKRRAEGWK